MPSIRIGVSCRGGVMPPPLLNLLGKVLNRVHQQQVSSREAEGLDTLRRTSCDNAGMLAGPIRFVDCL